jgi:FMN phosphatase YigB (HAD superfamily)
MKPGDWWTKVRVAYDTVDHALSLLWLQVIRATFSPAKLPPQLAPDLISRFATSAAYELYPSVPALLRAIRFNDAYDRTVIGVVSNSDPRVWSILNSLGVAVKGYQTTAPAASNAHRQDIEDSPNTMEGRNGSIDFLTLSYDVGVEKPDKRIFDAAFEKAQSVLTGHASYGEKIEWTRVHVGDNLKKDVEAAEIAGWRAILWDGKRRPEAVLKEILTDH